MKPSAKPRRGNALRWIVALLLLVLFVVWIVSTAEQYLTVDQNASMADMPGIVGTQAVTVEGPTPTSMPENMPGMDH